MQIGLKKICQTLFQCLKMLFKQIDFLGILVVRWPLPSLFLHEDSNVADLIDADSKCWNFYLIDQVFLPFKAHRIKSIPLCFSP